MITRWFASKINSVRISDSDIVVGDGNSDGTNGSTDIRLSSFVLPYLGQNSSLLLYCPGTDRRRSFGSTLSSNHSMIVSPDEKFEQSSGVFLLLLMLLSVP